MLIAASRNHQEDAVALIPRMPFYLAYRLAKHFRSWLAARGVPGTLAFAKASYPLGARCHRIWCKLGSAKALIGGGRNFSFLESGPVLMAEGSHLLPIASGCFSAMNIGE